MTYTLVGGDTFFRVDNFDYFVIPKTFIVQHDESRVSLYACSNPSNFAQVIEQLTALFNDAIQNDTRPRRKQKAPITSLDIVANEGIAYDLENRVARVLNMGKTTLEKLIIRCFNQEYLETLFSQLEKNAIRSLEVNLCKLPLDERGIRALKLFADSTQGDFKSFKLSASVTQKVFNNLMGVLADARYLRELDLTGLLIVKDPQFTGSVNQSLVLLRSLEKIVCGYDNTKNITPKTFLEALMPIPILGRNHYGMSEVSLIRSALKIVNLRNVFVRYFTHENQRLELRETLPLILSSLRNLEELDLSFNQLDDDILLKGIVSTLTVYNPALRTLKLAHCGLTEDALQILVPLIKRVENLDISNNHFSVSPFWVYTLLY